MVECAFRYLCGSQIQKEDAVQVNLSVGKFEGVVDMQAAFDQQAVGIDLSAASIEDAVYLQGYAMAQDRLWQMDMARRLPSGEIAEVVGRAGV